MRDNIVRVALDAPPDRQGPRPFTCVGLSLASRPERWEHLRREVAAKAAGSCHSLWRSTSITPNSTAYAAAMGGAFSRRLWMHFPRPGARALVLTVNATLHALLASTERAFSFPAILFEDDAVRVMSQLIEAIAFMHGRGVVQ